jgi:hypothetical protein
VTLRRIGDRVAKLSSVSSGSRRVFRTRSVRSPMTPRGTGTTMRRAVVHRER